MGCHFLLTGMGEKITGENTIIFQEQSLFWALDIRS
jgi:hypothetical protein